MNNQPLKIPPQSTEAEQSVLGGAMCKKECALAMVAGLDSEDFYKEAHSIIFEAIKNLLDEGTPIDIVTMGEYLEKVELLDKVGGNYYLANLADSWTGTPAEFHVKIVKEKAALRRLISVGNQITADGYKAEKSPIIITNYYVGALNQIAEDVSGCEAPDQLNFDNIDFDMLPVFSEDINNAIGGYHPGNITIIGGNTRQGKTSFCLDQATHTASDGGRVLIFNGKEQSGMLSRRILCNT